VMGSFVCADVYLSTVCGPKSTAILPQSLSLLFTITAKPSSSPGRVNRASRRPRVAHPYTGSLLVQHEDSVVQTLTEAWLVNTRTVQHSEHAGRCDRIGKGDFIDLPTHAPYARAHRYCIPRILLRGLRRYSDVPVTSRRPSVVAWPSPSGRWATSYVR